MLDSLASGGGYGFDYLLGEMGTYAPPPALPFLNTLDTMRPGGGCLIRATQAGTVTTGHSIVTSEREGS